MSESEAAVRSCAWCGANFRPGTIGRAAVYCRRSCRQRAYEARREAQRIALALAVAAVDSSRDRAGRPDSTRDETGSGQAPEPVPLDPRDGWLRSVAEVDAQLRELEARRAAAPPVQRKRRRLASPQQPDAPTLFEPEVDSAGGSRGGASGTANDTLPGHGETRTDTE
jgi:hypothetical protein